MCTEQKRQHGDIATSTSMDSGRPTAPSRNTQNPQIIFYFPPYCSRNSIFKDVLSKIKVCFFLMNKV